MITAILCRQKTTVSPEEASFGDEKQRFNHVGGEKKVTYMGRKSRQKSGTDRRVT